MKGCFNTIGFCLMFFFEQRLSKRPQKKARVLFANSTAKCTVGSAYYATLTGLQHYKSISDFASKRVSD